MIATPRAAGAALLLAVLCWAACEAVDASAPPTKGLPSARCLTPKGEELDFADLVAQECKKPDKKKPYPPQLPPPKTSASDTPKSPGVTVTVTKQEKKGKDDCERGVTARELQRNIVESKDNRCVAQILIQTGSVGGIEDGFRIDPKFNFKENCGRRELDPDVVALKGVSLGLLEGRPMDDGLVDKILGGLLPAFTPPGESEVRMGKETFSVDRETFRRELSNATLLLDTFNEDPNSVPPCKKAYPPPPSKPGKYPGGGRRLMDGLLGDRRLDEPVFGLPTRRLQCSACDNADSFVCAYCWQRDFCANRYWCQDP